MEHPQSLGAGPTATGSDDTCAESVAAPAASFVPFAILDALQKAVNRKRQGVRAAARKPNKAESRKVE